MVRHSAVRKDALFPLIRSVPELLILSPLDVLSFLVCKHRHSGVAETANPGSGNRESGNAETAIAVMSYGCRI